MRYQIKNNLITLEIESAGAEIRSLKTADGREYMWQGDAKFWEGTAPVLFPDVGRLNGGKYRTGGKEYSMGIHGFASRCEFEAVNTGDGFAVFRLRENEETLNIFPFGFELEISYRLVERSVVTAWKVTNTNDEKMSFALGGHPGFNCAPKGYEFHLYDAEDKPVTALKRTKVDSSGLWIKKEYDLVLDGGKLPIANEMFDEDALLLLESPVRKVSIADELGNEYISVKTGAPVLGLWSPAGMNAPFVCIEPWYGMCDPAGYEGDWEEREFINTLEPGEIFEAEMTIEIKD